MAYIKFETKGLIEHLERIQQMGVDIDAAVDRAMLPSAEVLQREMKALVPVDEGNLRDHIQIDGPRQDGNFHSIEVGVIHKRGLTDAKTARYGNVQEYGSSSVGAQPYMRPAVERKKGPVRRLIRESLKNEGLV